MSTLLDDQYYEDIKNLHHPLTKEDAFQLMLKGYSFVPKETLLDTSIYISVYLHWEHESFWLVPNNFYEREQIIRRKNVLQKRNHHRTSSEKNRRK